ncbi:hypothetical protein WDW37_08905 [Bdellovibrionota bacterium FG-1]
MCHECMPSAGWYQAIQKKCGCCGWRLHEACNDVEMCFYCDWIESDGQREQRIKRKNKRGY